MPTDHIEYDLFISYARLDNHGDWIKSYVNALAEEFHKFTGGRALKYFWDTERIPDFSHWEAEIFNKGIARSKLFLAFLSPNYCGSEVCRREWRAWIEREIGMHILSEGAAPIYIIEIPSLYGKPLPPEHDAARQIAELCKVPLPREAFILETEGVVREFRRRQLRAVQHFYNSGLTALQQQDLRLQLRTLAEELEHKSENIRRASASQSTVPNYNPKFTGRVDELVELRQLLVDNSTGVVAGIHGLGGIGKTELAFTFAHAYGGVYPGGRYYVRCEQRTSLADAFTQFEDDPFHDEITQAERDDVQANFNAVYRCLQKRLKELGPVLLVLDNVSDAALLHPEETGKISKLVPHLHLLATTRLPEMAGMKTLKLGELKPHEALALLEKFRPFTTAEERAAAEEIVRQLGGFAMAVELVAARLSVRKSATYAGVLNGLDLDKLDTYAEDQNVILQRHNHEKRLHAVLEPTLAELTPEALCLLEYAAWLPPDKVVLPWLRQLVLAEFPALSQPGMDGEDLWFELVASLFQLSLFNGILGGHELPHATRLHRLIGDLLRARPLDHRRAALVAMLAARTDRITDSQSPPADWELDGLLDAIPHLLAFQVDRDLANAGTFLADVVSTRRNLPATHKLLQATHASLQAVLAQDPGNAA